MARLAPGMLAPWRYSCLAGYSLLAGLDENVFAFLQRVDFFLSPHL